jgi:hypothetical protein
MRPLRFILLLPLLLPISCRPLNSQGDSPRLGSMVHTRSVECEYIHEKITHCKLLPGHTLDDAMQDWWDLYVGAIMQNHDDDGSIDGE